MTKPHHVQSITALAVHQLWFGSSAAVTIIKYKTSTCLQYIDNPVLRVRLLGLGDADDKLAVSDVRRDALWVHVQRQLRTAHTQ